MFKLSTNGKGLWTQAKQEVICLGFECEDNFYLKIYFDPKSWSVEKNGLIYTDPLFLAEAKLYFLKNFDVQVVFDYSESGMQGSDYVHFDINKQDYKKLEQLDQFDSKKAELVNFAQKLQEGIQVEVVIDQNLKLITTDNRFKFLTKSLNNDLCSKLCATVFYNLPNKFWKEQFNSKLALVKNINYFYCATEHQAILYSSLSSYSKAFAHDYYLFLSEGINDWEEQNNAEFKMEWINEREK
jgi:hypothetical protein